MSGGAGAKTGKGGLTFSTLPQCHAAVSFSSDSESRPSLHFTSDRLSVSKLLRSRKGAVLITVTTLRNVIRSAKESIFDSRPSSLNVPEFQWQKDILVSTVVESVGIVNSLLKLPIGPSAELLLTQIRPSLIHVRISYLL